MNIIELLPMLSLFIAGISNAFQILGIIAATETKHLRPTFNLLRKKLPSWLSSPLFSCHKCMSSIHGILFYFIVYGGDNLGELMFYIPMVCGLSVYFSKRITFV